MRKDILDAGAIIAYLDESDKYHDWGLAVFDSIKPPFYTCEAVITETLHMIRKNIRNNAQDYLLGLLEAKIIKCDLDLNHHISRVRTIMLKYADSKIDFADACIVTMTEQTKFDDCVVWTVDRTDFSIYKRHGRSAIPFEAP